MKKRSLGKIHRNLTEQYKVWRRGDLPPLEGGGGGGGLGSTTGGGGKPSVWRIGSDGSRTSVPPPLRKPSISPDEARAAAAARKRAEELATGQVPKEGPKVWRKGQEQSPPPAQTPQEKLTAQAQEKAKTTGEPVITVEPGSFTSKMLDKIFPEPKVKVEPKLKEPDQPTMRADRSARADKKVEPTLEPTQSVFSTDTKIKGTESEAEKNARNARYWRNFLGATGLAGTAATGYGLYKAYELAKEKAKEYFPPTDQTKPSWTPADDLLKYDPKNEAKETPANNYDKDQYISWAKAYAEKYGVPLSLALHAMYNETGWLRDPNKMARATSPTGARGVMQIQPEFAEKGYGIKVKDLTDPQKNIEAGVRGLAKYLKQFGSPENALAAYNAGPGGASKFIKTGDVKFLKPETRKYIMNYKDDVIHNLEKFYPKDKKKIAQVATDILGTVAGAKDAQAADVTPISTKNKLDTDSDLDAKLKKDEKVSNIAASRAAEIDKQIATGRDLEAKIKAEIEKNKAELDKITKKGNSTKTSTADTTTSPATKNIKISAADVKNLPPVELFGHIFPGIDWNKQGGIGGISTKDYTLPDGTVITDKRALDKIRSMQQQSKTINTGNDQSSTKTISKDVSAPPVVPAEPAPPENKQLSKTAQRSLSDFEKAFAAARAEKGPAGQFTFFNPRSGKEEVYTTLYKGEKPISTQALSKVNKDEKNLEKDISNQIQTLKSTPQLESINTELNEILRLAGRK